MSGDATPSRVTLAIVDDHELVREGLVALLRDSHSDASEFSPDVVYAGPSLDEALAASPDVVLLDIVLPDDSRPLVERVQCVRASGAAVLLLSATATTGAVLDGMRAGALGFVSKGASFGELVRAVEEVSHGEVHLTVDLAVVIAADAERPSLSAQELTCLRLYASGLKIAAIGHRMSVSPHTVKEYLNRVRTKYAAIGRDVRTRTQLYAAASEDGLLPGS